MKTIIVTGASDGIGKSIAIKLSEQKVNLILLGRDEARLQDVKKSCESNGSNTQTYSFDLNDSERRKSIVDEIISKQPVDVLINNAGIWHKAGDLATISEEKIIETINTNLTSQILLTRQLLPQMQDRNGTVIVNIISKSGVLAQAGQSVYTASKYGLKGFTDVLREDLKEKPIRIAAVYQSGTNTKLFAKAGEEFSTDKFTNPDDLADVVVFMLTRPQKIWLNEVHVTY